jgi:hypothetical protein
VVCAIDAKNTSIPFMLRNPIDELFDDSKRKLEKISAQAEALRAKKEELTRKVEALEALSRTVRRPIEVMEFAPRAPIWLWLRAVLEDAGQPLRVPEIYDRLISQGCKIEGARPKDALRIAMLRKPEMFLNQGGFFRLQTGPNREATK